MNLLYDSSLESAALKLVFLVVVLFFFNADRNGEKESNMDF